MNTEATLENTAPVTPGARLRQAREQLGLTQQTVAERLCLKLSTVREIEDNNTPPDLAPTFLRGYIRSYAKLVHLPESELLPVLDKHVVPRPSNVAPMQSFSLGKSRKKRDGWLMTFTWLVLLVVLGLTGAWWWQNHQAQQQEINSIVDHAVATAPDVLEGQPAGSPDNSTSQPIDLTQISPASPVEATANDANVTNPAVNSAPVAMPAPQATVPSANVPAVSPAANASTVASATPHNGDAGVTANSILMNFTADCWLEVVDATGKKLFSGIQRSGGVLNLSGQPPFRLKIGAPAAVQIQYLGKAVDLSRFVRSNQVARLTLAAE